MNTALQVTMTRTIRGEPLVMLDGLPGGSADLTPPQLRALADALNRIATDCEAQLPVGGKPLRNDRRQYPIYPTPQRS